jgi:integrase
MAMSDKDVSNYLGSLYKDRNIDPDQGWISNHNTMAAPISKFYRWLYYSDKSPQERRHLSKEQLAQIPQLKLLHFIPTSGKPRSPIKASDIWREQDIATCLKYLEGNPRLACWISMTWDACLRPEEALQLRLRDIEIRKDKHGRLAAALDVGRYSKKKKSRIVGMFDSVKYYRAWRQQHPAASNPDAYVFISKEPSAKYQNVPMSVDALRFELKKLKHQYFPTLLKKRQQDIPLEEKQKIEKLLTKKFNPYTLRHSAISRLARNPSVNDYQRKLWAGWTKSSTMLDVYTHQMPSDTFEDVMLAFGVDFKDNKQKQEMEQQLRGKICPHCNMENLPNAQFCSECNFVLTLEAFSQTKEETEQTKNELAEVRKLFAKIEENEVKLKQRSEELAALQNHILKRLAWQEAKEKRKKNRV